MDEKILGMVVGKTSNFHRCYLTGEERTGCENCEYAKGFLNYHVVCELVDKKEILPIIREVYKWASDVGNDTILDMLVDGGWVDLETYELKF